MAKKIKLKKEPTEDEQKAEEAKAAEEAAKAAAGIQDEFQARGFELVEWVHEKQGIFLGILGAIVAGGLAYGVYNVVEKNRNSGASASLAEALEVFEAPVQATGDKADDAAASDGPSFKDATERATKARELFQKTASEHQGTGAAGIAHLYAGHTSMKLGDYDTAVKEYEAFLAATSKDDPLRFAGLSGIAAALDAKGDRKGAIAKLDELVNLPSTIDEDAALLELGRLYQAEGDAAAARRALERIGKDFPESTLKSRAEEMLATLGAAPAPAPAPAPSAGAPAP